MNHSLGPHHKMWTTASAPARESTSFQKRFGRRQEQGYTLVALLALMAVLAIRTRRRTFHQTRRNVSVRSKRSFEERKWLRRSVCITLLWQPDLAPASTLYRLPLINFSKAYRSAQRKCKYFVPRRARCSFRVWRAVVGSTTFSANYRFHAFGHAVRRKRPAPLLMTNNSNRQNKIWRQS